jgi:hypothetical protein
MQDQLTPQGALHCSQKIAAPLFFLRGNPFPPSPRIVRRGLPDFGWCTCDNRFSRFCSKGPGDVEDPYGFDAMLLPQQKPQNPEKSI